jgi:hypothetical protein
VKDAWGSPINLGSNVNTSEDELFPYVDEAGIIYYSSKGFLGMGGLDIFKTSDDSDEDTSGSIPPDYKDIKKLTVYNLLQSLRNSKKVVHEAPVETSGGGTRGGASGYPNDPRAQEKEPPSLPELFNSLRDVSVKIITIYHKLINDAGGEEDAIEEFFKSEVSDEDEKEAKKEKQNKEDEKNISKIKDDDKKETERNEYESKDVEKADLITSKILANNKKNELLKAKQTMINDVSKEIRELFIKLYKICNDIKNIPQATEYEDHIKDILSKSNIKFFENKDDKDKQNQHPIIKAIDKELGATAKEIGDIKIESDSFQKELTSEKQRGDLRITSQKGQYGYPQPPPQNPDPTQNVNIEKFKRKMAPETIPYDKHEKFAKLVNQLTRFVKELKENTENVTTDNGKPAKSVKDVNIFDKIWNNYTDGMNRNEYKDADNKYRNQFNSLREGRKLYDSVIQNNLDPEIILEVNLQDKAIFIFLIFIIRTIIVIAIEFLIEYNMVKTLQFSIILYAFTYLLILCFFIVFVNYDSYKLRIIFNYLNLHINSSNIMLHIILFAVFTALVYIIIQSDNFLKNFGYMFDYTNIYNHIYDVNGVFTEESDTHISRNEKLKLLYRTDIISMLVFIFTSTLVLIM